ncbi:hypothetical protein [Beijerinckia sp. L45]|uniref:hypothetical protein n=1 Tax=Beijerinckia sp. L45 TaxID=1641855 RepID=UPI00131D5F63|nr:hypothetical protein [Beijerinckia sp. L45]
MRFFVGLIAFAMLAAAQRPARADMGATITGAAPTLSDDEFTPLDRHRDEITPEPANPMITGTEPLQPQAPSWTRPLTERQLGATERASDLAPDLLDALLRIESIYDPTRVDLFGETPAMEIRAGTASMNNVFADRWHLADTDPNVHYRVRYLAQAWMRSGDSDCDAFSKNRSSDGGPALTALSASDCDRLARVRSNPDEAWMVIARAAVDLPVFAAPLPGARLSSNDFWAAQKARIAAIQTRLQTKWQAPTALSAR